jgi:hypothetical protein
MLEYVVIGCLLSIWLVDLHLPADVFALFWMFVLGPIVYGVLRSYEFY